MRRALLTLAMIAGASTAGYAQTRVSPQPSGTSNSIIRVPPSTGASSGNSGSIAPATPYYPAPLRDLNNPAATYGNRFVAPNTAGRRR